MADEEHEAQGEQKPLRDQLNDKLVDVRNEAIVQAANLYLFGRKALLASIGLGALSLDAVQSLLERAVERGEIAESDAQAMLKRMQQHGADQAKERDEALAEMADKASLALSDSTHTIMSVLGRAPKTLPGQESVSEVETETVTPEPYIDPGDAMSDVDAGLAGDVQESD